MELNKLVDNSISKMLESRLPLWCKLEPERFTYSIPT